MGVINNEINLSKNDSILIYGVGGVGLNINRSWKQPKNIIAVDQFDVKLNKTQEFGANHLINTKHPNIRDELLISWVNIQNIIFKLQVILGY